MAGMKMGPENDRKFESEILPLCRVYGRAVKESTEDARSDGLGTGVQFKDVILGSDPEVKARVFLPKSQAEASNEKLPVLLYFHGGGFFMESAFNQSYHALVEALSHQCRLLAVSVEYRLAPAHKLPAAYDDALTALKWVFSGTDEWVAEHGDLEHVFVGGDSAGANITHNLAMDYAPDQAVGSAGMKIEGIALLCPYFWGMEPVPGETTDEGIRALITLAWYYVGLSPTDPRVDPLASSAPSLAGLGCNKVFVCLADQDVFHPRGGAYVQGLKDSGWKGELTPQVYEGVGHVFFLDNLDYPEAKKLMADLQGFFGTTN